MKRQIFKGFYVRAIHKGHPDMLPASVLEVENSAKREGVSFDRRWEEDIEIWSGRFEQYLTDPETEPEFVWMGN